MVVYADSLEQMVEIVAGLVREGLSFESEYQGSERGWKISLTGGY